MTIGVFKKNNTKRIEFVVFDLAKKPTISTNSTTQNIAMIVFNCLFRIFSAIPYASSLYVTVYLTTNILLKRVLKYNTLKFAIPFT